MSLIINCRSGRSFPECPEDSDVKTCTQDMDPVAFNTYTEFFTHAHSICHYLQSERWQQRAENTIYRYKGPWVPLSNMKGICVYKIFM